MSITHHKQPDRSILGTHQKTAEDLNFLQIYISNESRIDEI